MTMQKDDYQRIVTAVLKCNPIRACNRADDTLEPPWEVIDRVRGERDALLQERDALAERVLELEHAAVELKQTKGALSANNMLLIDAEKDASRYRHWRKVSVAYFLGNSEPICDDEELMMTMPDPSTNEAFDARIDAAIKGAAYRGAQVRADHNARPLVESEDQAIRAAWKANDVRYQNKPLPSDWPIIDSERVAYRAGSLRADAAQAATYETNVALRAERDALAAKVREFERVLQLHVEAERIYFKPDVAGWQDAYQAACIESRAALKAQP